MIKTKLILFFVAGILLALLGSDAFAVGYPRIMQNSSFDLRKNLAAVTFPTPPELNNQGTWAYWGDDSCPSGVTNACIAAWKTTGNTGCGGSPATGSCVEIAQASTYNSGANTPNVGSQIVAELNASQQSRIYQLACMLAGESVIMRYSFSPRANAGGDQQVTAGIWDISNTGPIGGALAFTDSSLRAQGDGLGFRPETATFVAPVTGVYQLGLEAKLPATGSNGNLIDDISIELIPLIDLDAQANYTLIEGGLSSTLTLRINGTVPTGGVTVALRLSGGAATEADFTLGTPVGLVGTTPTITHPSSGLWLVFVPAGQYDAGTGLVGNTRYGITIPVTATYDYPLREPGEDLQFTLQTPSADGSSPGTLWQRTNPICQGDSNSVVTYDIVEARPKIRINKRLASIGTAGDNFTTQIKDVGGTVVSSTTASPGGGVTTPSAVGTYTASASFQGNYDQTYTLTEIMPTGGPLSGYATSINCTNARTVGSPTTLPSGFGQSFTVSPKDADDITCLLINGNAPPPTLTVSKISNGNTGTFAFSGDNGFGSQAITTLSSGVARAGTTQTITNPYTDVTVTETSLAAGFALIDASCTDTNSANTGNVGTFGSLNLATAALTIPANRVVPGSTISCVFTNATPTLSVQKISQGGIGTFSFSSASNLASTPASITTTAVNTATPATPSGIRINTVGQAVSFSETLPTGYRLTGLTCTDSNRAITGNPESFGSFSGSTITIPAINVVLGASINCVLTNTRTTVKIQKITRGGFGETFAFSQSNLNGTPPNITTFVEDLAFPTTPTTFFVTSLGTDTDITEFQNPSYYPLDSDTLCTDANAAVTLNPTNFGSVASNRLRIPATNVRAGADITCTFVNKKRATVRVQKITQGGVGGTFTFSDTNLDGSVGGLTTTTVGIPVTAIALNVTSLNTAVTLTETPISGYALTSAVCNDVNSANSGNPASFGTFLGNTLTIPAANIVAGADISCVFTNTRPTVAFQVQTVGAAGGAFNFSAASNLASTPSAITTTAPNTPTPTTATPINVTSVGVAVSLTQTPPSGFVLTGVSCTDANSAVTGKTGIFGSLAGNVLTIPAGNIVAGAAITCVFTDTANSDYGDAPSSYGTAMHRITGLPSLYLGNIAPDIDSNTNVSTWQGQTIANGDDTTGTADEGVLQLQSSVFPNFPVLLASDSNYALTLRCSGSATVAAWIDFNKNNAFDNGERVQGSCSSGLVTLSWSGLSGLTTGNTYARFRIASNASELALPTGAAADGEVEDYPFTIGLASRTVTGVVFKDSGTGSGIANNGIVDGTELGIASVTVKLTDCAAAPATIIYSTSTTDGNGNYSLDAGSVPTGTVCIEETNLSSYTSTGASISSTPLPTTIATTVLGTIYTYNRTTDKISFNLVAGTSYPGLNFGDVPPNQFTTDGVKSGIAGSTVIYPHTFIAGSGGTVSFDLPGATASPAVSGWTEVLYTDSNCNTLLDSGEIQTVATAIAVSENDQICLILKQFIPAGAAIGASNLVPVKANFIYTNASSLVASYTRQDLTTVSNGALDLKKMVRNVTRDGAGVPDWKLTNTAKSGEVLEYKITYTNNGPTPLSSLILNDSTPAFTTFVSALSGAIPLNLSNCTKTTPTASTPIVCSVVDTTGGTGGIKWRFNGSLAPGANGIVTFKVKVD